MAPIRSIPVRRSRRLSMQVPVKYDDDGWESSDLAMGHVPPMVDDAATHSPLPLTTPDESSRHVPRPPNPFLQFRSAYWQRNQRDRNNRNVSRACGLLWNAMPAAERRIYQEMALVAKAEHKVKNPDWSYKSAAKGKKSTTRQPRNVEDEKKCRKIAGKLREGVESTAVQTKMEVKAEQPVYAIPSPSPSIAADEDRAAAPDHATSTAKKEEEEEAAFVPTAAIPPLDLNIAAAEKGEFVFNTSVQHPVYLRIDPQFGSNPDVGMDANAFLLADDTARAEVFDPVENYLPDYANMSEELDALMTDIVRPETEFLPFYVDCAYI
ncbi:hypothetical protein F5146DRAFT_169192 [Armillaria mellea]|nr:hypothetical protein F5146DRAFT_169192 [Armillaria mellea]